MLSSGVILALGGTLLLVVADSVPSLNVEPLSRGSEDGRKLELRHHTPAMSC